MRKRLTAVLSLLLAALLLAGCGMPAPLLTGPLHKTREDYATLTLRPFNRMPYQRPDVEAIRAKADEIKDALNGGVRFRKLTRMLDEFYSMYYSADTMYTIADIRNCQDLTNRRSTPSMQADTLCLKVGHGELGFATLHGFIVADSNTAAVGHRLGIYFEDVAKTAQSLPDLHELFVHFITICCVIRPQSYKL